MNMGLPRFVGFSVRRAYGLPRGMRRVAGVARLNEMNLTNISSAIVSQCGAIPVYFGVSREWVCQ